MNTTEESYGHKNPRHPEMGVSVSLCADWRMSSPCIALHCPGHPSLTGRCRIRFDSFNSTGYIPESTFTASSYGLYTSSPEVRF